MRWISLIVLSFLLFSCGDPIDQESVVNKAPDKLLSKEVFTEMLMDSYMMESAIRLEVSRGATDEEMSQYFYPQLFEKYDITEEEFKENIKFYSRDPKLMQEIQTTMVNRLTIKEEELMNL